MSSAALRVDPERDARAALDEGDRRGALTIAMQAFGADVYRHCLAVLGGRRELADEVHQSVFVQAFRDLDRFSGHGSLRTWLYAIARHRCLDALKLRRRLLARVVAVARLPDAAAAEPAADEALALEARRRALAVCLARLAPAVRIAVLLRYQEGMSYEEMARVCGARPATLQARVARALPRLREWLSAMGFGDAL
jgi:RNA polymerase sigma-70 factor (ECF subfamily)